MNAANVTETAMSQGLNEGFQFFSSAAGAPGVFPALPLPLAAPFLRPPFDGARLPPLPLI